MESWQGTLLILGKGQPCQASESNQIFPAGTISQDWEFMHKTCQGGLTQQVTHDPVLSKQTENQ